MIDLDDAAPRHRRPESEALIGALIASYDHATSHISEFAKLQYQLVAIAYGLAGAAIAFFGDQLTQPQVQVQGTFLLALPVIFYALVFVQVYLHSQIKRYGRYVNYKLRPKMEAIVQTQLKTTEQVALWDWEETYKHGITKSIGTAIEGLASRILSLLILALPLIPAMGAIVIFELLNAGRTYRDVELFVRNANLVGLVGAIALIGIIGYVNVTSLEREGQRYAEKEKQYVLQLLDKQTSQLGSDPVKDAVIAGLIEDQTDPEILLQAALLASSPEHARKLVDRVRKIKKPTPLTS
ncbi:MAG: hypothetical protein IPK17_30820 [Chloroflexi bacterium]|uniref:hypothetical protein n=1 Tax=Candidatus Flexifilum breve TaxID=3140694 RepID=UPI00313751A2|nr:hypothetical protein [Chloroflexota bacterium]